MLNGGSILDKIITQQRDSELAKFNGLELKKALFSHLKEREADILIQRFGLGGEKRKTLEEIGRAYQVTRERVRQIEILAIKKLLRILKNDARFEALTNAVRHVLQESGGVREHNDLIDTLLAVSTVKSSVEDDSKESSDALKNFFMFCLNHLWRESFIRIEAKDGFNSGWRLPGTPLDSLKSIIGEAEKIIREEGKPFAEDELIRRIQETPVWSFYREKHLVYMPRHSDGKYVISAQLCLGIGIQANIFNEWGLVSWPLVKPGRMTDKIYLILKHHGKPLHFRDIANMINEAGFDHKKAYGPTIHNELILDTRYVLIGRGIYALAEWGYYPGTVAEVITHILKESPDPLHRDIIVKKVLQQRRVNEATIKLALTNKKRFKKGEDNTFALNK